MAIFVQPVGLLKPYKVTLSRNTLTSSALITRSVDYASLTRHKKKPPSGAFLVSVGLSWFVPVFVIENRIP